MRRGVVGVRAKSYELPEGRRKARIAAEEEAKRIAAEEQHASLPRRRRPASRRRKNVRLAEGAVAAATLRCLVRRYDALSEFEVMKRRWTGVKIGRHPNQRAHRRQVQYWKFQYQREATKSCQKLFKSWRRARTCVGGVALLNAYCAACLAERRTGRCSAAAAGIRQGYRDQRMAKGKMARAEHQRKLAAAALLNRVGRGAIARGIAADIREERRLEKQAIMERYDDLLETGGSAECQDALKDPDFGVAHETHRDPDIIAAREALSARLAVVRKAENEAQILRAVVNDGKATMPMIEAALERSPEKYASVLPAVRDLRDTLSELALRRTELSQWRRKLSS